MDGKLHDPATISGSLASGKWYEDGTVYRFRLWRDPNGTWGVALPDFNWSAGDLGRSLTYGDGEWFAAHGLNRADARCLARLVEELRWFIDGEKPPLVIRGGLVDQTFPADARRRLREDRLGRAGDGDHFGRAGDPDPPLDFGRARVVLSDITPEGPARTCVFVPQALPGMAPTHQQGLGAPGGDE
jgi:hypothetical protein